MSKKKNSKQAIYDIYRFISKGILKMISSTTKDVIYGASV